jgi:F-type H+-transporting ATPase subunit alpha
VGGKTQLPAYRTVAADLKLSYAQFEELEAFSRFSSRLDEETQHRLDRGRLVREVFKQPEAQGRTVPQQIAVLLAVTSGVWDDVPLAEIRRLEEMLCEWLPHECSELCETMARGAPLEEDDLEHLLELARQVTREHHDAVD